MVQDSLVLRPKKCKGEDGYRVFSIRVHEDTVRRLDALSARSNRSRNELIGILLDYAIDRCVIEEDTEHP